MTALEPLQTWAHRWAADAFDSERYLGLPEG
jgi:hypothetical protein